jgi:hypothetical protein
LSCAEVISAWNYNHHVPINMPSEVVVVVVLVVLMHRDNSGFYDVHGV